jgi:hypothetical protein
MAYRSNFNLKGLFCFEFISVRFRVSAKAAKKIKFEKRRDIQKLKKRREIQNLKSFSENEGTLYFCRNRRGKVILIIEPFFSSGTNSEVK